MCVTLHVCTEYSDGVRKSAKRKSRVRRNIVALRSVHIMTVFAMCVSMVCRKTAQDQVEEAKRRGFDTASPSISQRSTPR